MPKIVICPTCGVLFDEDKRNESRVNPGTKSCPACGLPHKIGKAEKIECRAKC